MLLEAGGWVFPSWRFSQVISFVIFWWVYCLFSCMWILNIYFLYISVLVYVEIIIRWLKDSFCLVLEKWFWLDNPRLSKYCLSLNRYSFPWENKINQKIWGFCGLFIIDLRGFCFFISYDVLFVDLECGKWWVKQVSWLRIQIRVLCEKCCIWLPETKWTS